MSFIFGLLIYLVIGVIWAKVIGFSFKNKDYSPIVTSMIIWPISMIFVAVWTIEDVLINLSNRRR